MVTVVRSPARRRGRPLRVARRLLPAVVGEVCLLAAAYAAYAWVRDRHGRASGPDARAAMGHGAAIWQWEHRWHVAAERPLQRLALHSTAVVRALGAFYGAGYVLVTLGTLLALAVRRPRAYRSWRWSLLALTAVSMTVFALLPVAPPRLLPGGLVDTVARVGGLWDYDHGAVEHIADPYAAMPSLHVGWAVWVGLAASSTAGRRWRVAAWCYVVLTALTVVITGMHFVADVAAGALLASVVTAPLWWSRRGGDQTTPRPWAQEPRRWAAANAQPVRAPRAPRASRALRTAGAPRLPAAGDA